MGKNKCGQLVAESQYKQVSMTQGEKGDTAKEAVV